VNITSSKRGEASFVDATEKKRGSCFTWSLVALFDKHQNDTAITWQDFTAELSEDVKKAFLDSHPEGFKFNPPLNGIVQQTTQTIEIYGMLPGIAPAPAAVQQGPRFGVRAVALPGGGVRITYVLPGGPGARAGFEVGDTITEINGKHLQTEEDYSKAIDDSPKRVNAKVINGKDGRLLNVTFELGF
jgi:S1-C subfamily serine protease